MALPPLGVDESMPILKTTKLPTGIRELDILLEGGYQNPGNILLVGPSGMEKSAFAFHFAKAGSEKGHKVFYIATDTTPEDIINKAASVGIEIASGKDFKFIDCYSSTLGTAPSAFKETIPVPGPSALNDLSLAINEAIKESAGKKMVVVFHSLSSLVLYNPKDSILKFLQVVGGRLKNADATVVMLVEEGMHEKQLFAMLEHSMDAIFTIQDKGGSFELKIPDVEAMIPMRLSPTGIAIL